ITAFMGFGRLNSDRVTDIRGVLGPLEGIAERRNALIYTITHPPKASTSAINSFIGSQAFIAAARIGYLTTEEIGEDGKPTGRYLLSMVKSNLGPKVPTLAYRLEQLVVGQDHRDGTDIVGSRVWWESEPVAVTADQVLAAAQSGGKAEGPTALEDAKAFLRAKLAAGVVTQKEILEHAAAELISEATLRRAKSILKVESKREGFGADGRFVWLLPASIDDQDAP